MKNHLSASQLLSFSTSQLLSFLACQLVSLLAYQLVSTGLAYAEVSYNSKGKTLTVNVEGQALSELLNEIKEKTGIKVEIAEGVDGNVYQEFQNLNLENGLKRLLKTKNYSFIYKGNSIKKIKVFATGIPSASTIASASSPSRVSSPSSQIPSGAVSRPSEVKSEISADRQKLLDEQRMKFEESRKQKGEKRRQREGSSPERGSSGRSSKGKNID